MSVPAAAPRTRSPQPAARGARPLQLPRQLTGGRLYAWLAALALALAALSLLFPSTPSYDPWAWLVWGREILHGSLHTPGGPTWKPLPVIFTTVFALFGSAQPNLWLVVARAGAALGVMMTGVLALRLTWRLQRSVNEPVGDRPRRWSSALPALPAVLAALIAMASLALTGEFLDSSTLGYSEGLMVAAMLIALDRHLDGHYRQAFVFGFVATLDRPEVGLFWGPYGLWLMWRDPGSRGLVIGLAVLALALWFVPQKWGGGSFTSGVSRAQHPRSNSPAFAPCPFCAELKDHAWPLVLLRIKLAAALAVLCALAALWRGRASLPGWRAAVRRRNGDQPEGPAQRLLPPRTSALVTLIVAGVFGLVWWVLVAIETQAGFSGNDRYLVLGSAFIVLAGAVGFGWLATWLSSVARGVLMRARSSDSPTRARSPDSPMRARSPDSPTTARSPDSPTTAGSSDSRSGPARTATLAATTVSALLFVFAPNFVGPNLINLPKTHGSLLYQAQLREDLASLISTHGGAKAVLACGPVMAEGFQVPMVAWYLDVRTLEVADQPPTNANGLAPVPKGQWPATIFQDEDTRGATLLPLPQTIIGWEHEGAHYSATIGPHDTMHFFQDCRAHAAAIS